MNPRTKSVALLAILVVGALAFTGCASTKKQASVEQSQKATTAMLDVENDMKQTSVHIDATKASLEDLIRVGQSPTAQPPAVKSSFDTYSANVAKMEDMSKKLNKDIDAMNSESNKYFEAWAKEGATYTSPEVQKLSEQRRANLRASFTNIAQSGAGMRGSLNAHVAQLKQIQKYLSNDLSAQGIAAITPTAQAAIRDGDQLKLSFTPVQTAIERTRTDMTVGGTAAGGAGAAGAGSTSGTGQAPAPAQPQGTSPSTDSTTQYRY